MNNLRDEVKIFYDQAGQPAEVVMSYEIFQQLEMLLEAAGVDQAYFWGQDWQSRIREAEADIEAGRVKSVIAETVEAGLEWLDG